MTLTERTEKMIKAVAAIALRTPGSHESTELLLAAARWDTNPNRLRWCAVYPDDQHHIHQTEYARVVVYYERDVALYGPKGEMVAYICPIEESGLDLDQAKDTVAAWRKALALPHNQKEFDDFFAQD